MNPLLLLLCSSFFPPQRMAGYCTLILAAELALLHHGALFSTVNAAGFAVARPQTQRVRNLPAGVAPVDRGRHALFRAGIHVVGLGLIVAPWYPTTTWMLSGPGVFPDSPFWATTQGWVAQGGAERALQVANLAAYAARVRFHPRHPGGPPGTAAPFAGVDYYIVWLNSWGIVPMQVTHPSFRSQPGLVPFFFGAAPGAPFPGAAALLIAQAAQIQMGVRWAIWDRLQQNYIAGMVFLMGHGAVLTPLHFLRMVWRGTGVDQHPWGGVGGTGGQGLHMLDPRVLFWINHPSGVGLDIIFAVWGSYMGDWARRSPRIAHGFDHDDTPGGSGLFAVPDLVWAKVWGHIALMLGANYVYSEIPWSGALGRHSHMTVLHLSRSWHRSHLIMWPNGHCFVNPAMFLVALAGFMTRKERDGEHLTRNPCPQFVHYILNTATSRQRLVLLRFFMKDDGSQRPLWQGVARGLLTAFRHLASPAVPGPPFPADMKYCMAAQSNEHRPILRLMMLVALSLGFRSTRLFRLWGDMSAWRLVVEAPLGLLDMAY